MTEAATFREVRRAHVADDVFDQLAAAILRGDHAPGSALPPERSLVERFGVSRVLVRQAVHRLAELGLVRVRQGGATIILDPADATDLGVLALFYRFAPRGGVSAIDVGDMIEKQYLQGLSILDVAARRATRAELTALLARIDDERDAALVDFAAFEERYWRALAAIGKNRIFKMEVSFWYESLPERPIPLRVATTPVAIRFAFAREIVRRLVHDERPVEFYLESVRGLLAEVTRKGGPTP